MPGIWTEEAPGTIPEGKSIEQHTTSIRSKRLPNGVGALHGICQPNTRGGRAHGFHGAQEIRHELRRGMEQPGSGVAGFVLRARWTGSMMPFTYQRRGQ